MKILGCRELVKTIKGMRQKPKSLIFSALRDKESPAMLKILAELDIPIIVTALEHARSKKLADLAAEAESFFDKIIPAKNSAHALSILKKMTCPGDLVLVTGSFYLLGEIRREILNPNI